MVSTAVTALKVTGDKQLFKGYCNSGDILWKQSSDESSRRRVQAVNNRVTEIMVTY